MTLTAALAASGPRLLTTSGPNTRPGRGGSFGSYSEPNGPLSRWADGMRPAVPKRAHGNLASGVLPRSGWLE
jgi:hypothetical protein